MEVRRCGERNEIGGRGKRERRRGARSEEINGERKERWKTVERRRSRDLGYIRPVDLRATER